MTEEQMTLGERQDKHARAIAERVDPLVGLDPATLIMVVCALINVAINCWRASHAMDPQEAQDHLARQMKTSPSHTTWRLTHLIMRKSPRRVSLGQANAIANAMIAEAMASSNKESLRTLVRDCPALKDER